MFERPKGGIFEIITNVNGVETKTYEVRDFKEIDPLPEGLFQPVDFRRDGMSNTTCINLDEHNCLTINNEYGHHYFFMKDEDLGELYNILREWAYDGQEL